MKNNHEMKILKDVHFDSVQRQLSIVEDCLLIFWCFFCNLRICCCYLYNILCYQVSLYFLTLIRGACSQSYTASGTECSPTYSDVYTSVPKLN